MGYTCPRCGEEYQFGPSGEPLASIAVFWNDPDREDFTENLCQECTEAVLAELLDLQDDDTEDEE